MDQTIEVSTIARLVSVARTSSSAAINDQTFIPILKALLALHTRLRDLVEAQLPVTVPSILDGSVAVRLHYCKTK